MSGKVQGYRVREPRVVSRPGPSSQRGSANTTSSSLARAWAAFGEAKSAYIPSETVEVSLSEGNVPVTSADQLEKLNSSPPAKSSSAQLTTCHHSPPVPLATSADGVSLSLSASSAASQSSLRPASGGGRREKSSDSAKREPLSVQGRQRRQRREREAVPSPQVRCGVSAPPPWKHATPGAADPKPSGVPQSSSPHKINLADDTLATLRSKVEAQKLAVQATNSRIQSLRQSPAVTSDPCIYPLPEVTQSAASPSSALPTSTISHTHPLPPSHPSQPRGGASKRQPIPRKVTSIPPRPPAKSRGPLMTGGASSSGTQPGGGRGGVRVRKITHLSPPVDPLRSRSRPTAARASSSAQPLETTRKRQLREQTPPHSRSWALRPAATSVLEPVPGEKLEPEPGRGRGREEGFVGAKKDLAQLLRDLESSSGEASEGEGGSEKKSKKPLPVSSALKRRRLTDPEDEPLPPPPQTKPYDPAEVQRYIRVKQRERRLETRKRQEEAARERREREERQRELLQRQRKILQANLRSQQRWRETDLEPESSHVAINSPSHPSHSPRVSTQTVSPHFPSPRSSSPHTYTVSPNPAQSQFTSGASPPPPEEPIQTTGDQQSSHEDRILALTQSALELKKRIAAEAERLKKARSKIPSCVNITVTTATPPPSLAALPTSDLFSLPGVGSVHRQARLAEEARREGEAATRIQALFRGFSVRRSLAASLGRVGDGEEDGTRTNGVLKTSPNGVPKTATASVSHKPATPSQSVAVQTSTSVIQLEPTTAVPPPVSEKVSQPPPQVTTPPWQKGGGDPLSVINIFTRERSHLKQTLSQLRNQKLSELRQLETSTPRPLDHTHPFASTPRPLDHTHLSASMPRPLDHTHPSAEPQQSVNNDSSESDQFYSLSFASFQNSAPISAPSISTHLNESTDSKSPSKSHQCHTLTPSPKSHSASQCHSTSDTPPQTSARPDGEIPAITPPGSPSFVSSFTSGPHSGNQTTPSVTSGDPHRGPPGGRLSPRSLGLKLQAELGLLETIEESMRQLSAVEGNRAVTTARQGGLSLAELLERERLDHQREMSEAALRARAAEEDRAREREMELQRVREEAERREVGRKNELERQRQEVSQQLAEARAAASQAVISSARLQVEAAHNMAVSVATAAAKEAVSAAMVGVAHSPSSPPKTTPSEPTAYSTDFEGSVEPDSLAEEASIHTETGLSQLVPTARNSSGESTLTPGESEGGGGGEGDSHTSVPEEEIDGGTDPGPESSFRELLPSESHRRRHSRLSLSEPESRPSSPTHSVPHTPSSLPGDRSPSPFTPGGEDSFFQFMSRMMEQYMKEEEVRSRHRALLLQLREKALKERTKAEMEWLQVKQQRLRGKGEDERMPSLESRRKNLLRKLEAEQAEIRRLQRAQKEARRERRLMLEQHRAISHMQSSAQYYRDKLRRHSAQDHLEHPFTPSPTHPHSPAHSEVESQVSEEEAVSQLSYSPSPTPSHSGRDHSGSVAMPTDTAETTPTMVRQLRDHETFLGQREEQLLQRRRTAEETLRQQEQLARRQQALDEEERKINSLVSQTLHGLHSRSGGKPALTPKKLVETTPTRSLATPTTHAESEVISEVLDHTPSESVPEEVSEEATPTSSQRTTDYSNDLFEPTSGHTPSHPPPVTPSTPETESEPISESTGGVGSLEQRISQLRQQLQERREEVRRARGEQRQRKRAILKEEEDRLRRRLESLDSQLARLQSPAPLTNHVPPSSLHQSHPPSLPTTSQPVEEDTARATTDVPEDVSHSPLTGEETVTEQIVEEEEEEEGERSEEGASEVSELSQLLEEEEHEHYTSAEPPPQISLEPSEEQSGEPSAQFPESPALEPGQPPEEEVVEGEREVSYTETWPSEHSSTVSDSLPTSERRPEGEVESPTSERRPEGEVERISEPEAPVGVAFSAGQRVLVGGAEPGTIKFVGPTHFQPGVWIGVELDAEKGKNDGSIEDKQYFICAAGHGVFAPASKVSLLEEKEAKGSEGSSVPEEVGEEDWSEGSEQVSVAEGAEREPLSPPLGEGQGNEGEGEEAATGPGKETHPGPGEETHPGPGEETHPGPGEETHPGPGEETHPGPGEVAEVEGSRDLEPSSPAVPPPLTLPQEEVPTAPHLVAPPPDIEREAPKQTAEPQTARITTNVEHLTSDLVQELANEAFQTMHRIWRHRSPSSPTSPSAPRGNHVLETPSGPRRNNHHLSRGLGPTTEAEEKEALVMKKLEQRKRQSPELSMRADKISDQLLALLLKSETDLVCALRSSKSCREPSSPHWHSPSGLFTPPSLPTIQETVSPPPSPPPILPPPASPPLSPPGSPQRQLAPATAARVAAGERSPPLHRETSPPSLTPSLSCASLTSLVDQDDFTSAHCMVPSASHQVDSIVEQTCSLWNQLRGTNAEPALSPPDCPSHIISLFSSSQLSSNEEHCQVAYVKLVYDLTLQVLRDSAPREPEVSAWARFSPSLNSQLVAARQRRQPQFDLEKIQRRVRGKIVRGQLPSPLPPAKFLHGMRRVGGKDIDFIDSVLIRELRREEASWVDYHGDETVVKLRAADSLLESLLTETVHLISDIAERKRQPPS